MSNENNEVTSNNGMSKLVYWEVWNFMSFSHAKFEFDDKNIINLLGYNDSGKSAALRALEVNLYNRFPQSQLSFIQSGKDHFRVVTVWSDGIVILRDKYANGQSLYEMWRGEDCLFSTKQNGTLTKVADVPLCIQEYLCLVKFDDSYLNSRSCFEKQFLVQTSGGENYAALNTVLKSEELSLAGSLVNADRNKLGSDISVAETEYNVKMQKYKGGIGLTEVIVEELKSHDKLLDDSDSKLSSLGSLLDLSGKLAEIPELPNLGMISFDELQLLESVLSCQSSISALGDIPEMTPIATEQLESLVLLQSIEEKQESIKISPKVPVLDVSQLDSIAGVLKVIEEYNKNEEELKGIDVRLAKLDEESKELESLIKEFGISTVRCKNCGALVEVGGDGNGQECCGM